MILNKQKVIDLLKILIKTLIIKSEPIQKIEKKVSMHCDI